MIPQRQMFFVYACAAAVFIVLKTNVFFLTMFFVYACAAALFNSTRGMLAPPLQPRCAAPALLCYFSSRRRVMRPNSVQRAAFANHKPP